MKSYTINKLFWCFSLTSLLLSACTKEIATCDTPGKGEQAKEISIHISALPKEQSSSRATDALGVEAIKRYDVFIFDAATGVLDVHRGVSCATPLTEITEHILISETYRTDKNVFVVVNYDGWTSKTEEEIKQDVTIASIEAVTLTATQNYTGTTAAMTAFAGYKKSATENEPFVMSVSKKDYNFLTDGDILNLELKRTYAKAVLKIKGDGVTAANTDWLDLKYIKIYSVNNIPSVARLISTTSVGYSPAVTSYVFSAGSEYKNTSFTGVDLVAGYDFDTFSDGTMCLRLFPHAPTTHATSLEVEFAIGAKGTSAITKVFRRTIFIGNKADNYSIDPNTAHIITLYYGMTNSGVSVTSQVVPWNYTAFDTEVFPQ